MNFRRVLLSGMLTVGTYAIVAILEIYNNTVVEIYGQILYYSFAVILFIFFYTYSNNETRKKCRNIRNIRNI